MTIMPAQVRAARAVLNWSQGELSEAAGVARATVAEFEANKRVPIANNISAIRGALEGAGVIFVDGGPYSGDGGPGVRLKT